MPYSHEAPKAWCLARIDELNPSHILDVGPGAGLWGHALRNHRFTTEIDCIEAHGPYVTRFQLDALYDHVFIGDVRQWDWGGMHYVTVAESDAPVGPGEPVWTWDLVILGDVLEHMTKPEALAVVEQALMHADAVLVVVPLGEWPQSELQGNPLEAHVSTWGLTDLTPLPKLHNVEHWAVRMPQGSDTYGGHVAAALLGEWP